MTNEQLITLPKNNDSETFLSAITHDLGVSRDILPTEEDIQHAWNELPNLLRQVPKESINPMLVKMCIAVKSGLFDSAVNYIWNTSVTALRSKLKKFGLQVAAKILNRNDLDDNKIYDLKDNDLLQICLKLNLISEDGYFFLNQNREIRNNYSLAHPNKNNETIEKYELYSFFERCIKYSFNDDRELIGIDFKDFTQSLKSGSFSEDAISLWNDRIKKTTSAQRSSIFSLLYGVYVDKNSLESERGNAFKLLQLTRDTMSDNEISVLVEQYNTYLVKPDETKKTASRDLFKRLNLISYLTDSEKISIFSKAIDLLQQSHDGFDNFYNEVPFAEKLLQLRDSSAVPDILKEKYVTCLLDCYTGNPYGVSWGAIQFYENMIKELTSKEINIIIMLLNDKNSYISKKSAGYKKQFLSFLRSIPEDRISETKSKDFEKLLSRFEK